MLPHFIASRVEGEEIHLNVECPWCSRVNDLTVDNASFEQWANGTGLFIQDAFPEENSDTREMLLTGICPNCWAMTFGSPEDEETPFQGVLRNFKEGQ